MRQNAFKRHFVVASLVVVAMAATSGCSMFRKQNKLYAQSAETRPLEVPPDLDLPTTAGGVSLPAAPATASAAASAPAAGVANGFTIGASRDEAFTQVGEALGKIDGLSITSRAQLLGAYDVSYGGSDFLVRVSSAEAGANVAAVDPRGLPATGEAAVKVIAELKAALGGH